MAISIKNIDTRTIVSFLTLWAGVNLVLVNRFLFENIIQDFPGFLILNLGIGLFFTGTFLLFKRWTYRNRSLSVFGNFKTILAPMSISIMVLIPSIFSYFNLYIIPEYWSPFYYFFYSFTISAYLINIYYIYCNLIKNEGKSMPIRLLKAFSWFFAFGLLFMFIPKQYESSLFFPYITIGIIAILYIATRLSWIGRILPHNKWRLVGLLTVINLVNFIAFVHYSLNIDNYFFETTYYPFAPFFLLLLFVSVLSFTSLLSLLFYIPISATVERKTNEIDRLIKIGNLGRNQSQDVELYQYLLKAAVEDTKAMSGWFNFKSDEEALVQAKNISIDAIEKIESRLYHRLDPAFWKLKYFEINAATHPYIFDKELSGADKIISFNYNIDYKDVGRLYLIKGLHKNFTDDQKHFVRSYLKQARLSYQSKLLVDKQVESKRVDEEFRQARIIQQKLLPQYNVMDDAIDFDAFLHPCLELGGDFYDLFKIDNDRILFIMGDVAGKGLSASLYMAELKGIFQTLSTFDLDPKEFIYKINEVVMSCFEDKVFVTLTYLMINKSEKTFTYSRAGQSPLLYYCAKNNEVKYFEDEGMGIGIIRNNRFKEKIKIYKHNYEKGDVILLFSDGISEASNDAEQMFGLNGIKKAVEQAPKDNAQAINKFINRKIKAHTLKNPYQDDLTSLVIQFK